MIKTNLPVILLRGLVLLPNSEIRLEITAEIDKKMIQTSEIFHDNHILVVSSIDPLEEEPDINDLPKLGVIGKIKSSIEIDDTKLRVLIKGINRVNVFNYIKFDENDTLESVIGPIVVPDIKENEAIAYKKVLIKEVENYVSTIPTISNTVLAMINQSDSLGKLTDVVASYMPIDFERKLLYLNTLNPIDRVKMIIEDIRYDEEEFEIERQIDSELKKEIDDSQKEYILREKLRIIKEELGDTSIKEVEIDNLREKLQNSKFPEKVKSTIELEIKKYEAMPSTSPEIGQIRNYIDWLLELPWDTYTEDICNLESVKKSLDESHYGLDNIKLRIIEYLAVKQMSNDLNGPIICLVGPPGTGKTSLATSIAKAINKKFTKITVGGVTDEAELIGHRRTYIGAAPGRIIQGLKKAQSSNPVFLIDEIDKMSKDYKGDPSSILLEILDPEQNKSFSDNYIELDYDLSKVLFIATANYISQIPEALLDRLEIIELSSYTEFEKIDIAVNHLLPRRLAEHNLSNDKISISNDVIKYIIKNYTREAGVRELDRQLTTIIRKIVTKIVMNKELLSCYQVNLDNIEEYLGKEKYSLIEYENIDKIGVVNGMSYTTCGGDILPIEVINFKGKGEIVLTGNLGSVIKESAHIALDYIKSNYEYFSIDYNIFKNSIHIHFPEGAIPKDGPSAGIALTTAIISSLSNLKISNSIAMTGEVTLNGGVLPIGGLKEKVIGAYNRGIKTVIIPYENVKDLDEIPNEVKENIKFVPVKRYEEVYEYIRRNK